MYYVIINHGIAQRGKAAKQKNGTQIYADQKDNHEEHEGHEDKSFFLFFMLFMVNLILFNNLQENRAQKTQFRKLVVQIFLFLNSVLIRAYPW